MHAAKTQRSVCASYSLIRSSGRWKIASNAELFSLYFVFIRSFNSFIHWVGASFVHTTPMRFFFTHFEQILSLFVSLFFILIFFSSFFAVFIFFARAYAWCFGHFRTTRVQRQASSIRMHSMAMRLCIDFIRFSNIYALVFSWGRLVHGCLNITSVYLTECFASVSCVRVQKMNKLIWQWRKIEKRNVTFKIVLKKFFSVATTTAQRFGVFSHVAPERRPSWNAVPATDEFVKDEDWKRCKMNVRSVHNCTSYRPCT